MGSVGGIGIIVGDGFLCFCVGGGCLFRLWVYDIDYFLGIG